jgi:hypothetical protein
MVQFFNPNPKLDRSSIGRVTQAAATFRSQACKGTHNVCQRYTLSLVIPFHSRQHAQVKSYAVVRVIFTRLLAPWSTQKGRSVLLTVSEFRTPQVSALICQRMQKPWTSSTVTAFSDDDHLRVRVKAREPHRPGDVPRAA